MGWRDGQMHGLGEFENFSIGVDRIFKGVCVAGQFKSGLENQAEAKRAFLKDYASEYAASITTWLRAMAERAQPPEEDPKAKGKKNDAEPEFPADVLREIMVPPEASADGDADADSQAAVAK